MSCRSHATESTATLLTSMSVDMKKGRLRARSVRDCFLSHTRQPYCGNVFLE